jgi:hypothetical protein
LRRYADAFVSAPLCILSCGASNPWILQNLARTEVDAVSRNMSPLGKYPFGAFVLTEARPTEKLLCDILPRLWD